MSSKFAVWTAIKLKTGEVAISGSVSGPRLTVGRNGVAQTPGGNIEVVIVGIGVSDPTIGPPDRQGILVRMQRGEADDFGGATIEFT
jgi:hypothetical protein